MSVTLASLRQRCDALRAMPDPPAGMKGALDALLAVGQRYALKKQQADLDDLDALLTEMRNRWATEKRESQLRMWTKLNGNRKKKPEEEDVTDDAE